jgi:hypothetical protein
VFIHLNWNRKPSELGSRGSQGSQGFNFSFVIFPIFSDVVVEELIIPLSHFLVDTTFKVAEAIWKSDTDT